MKTLSNADLAALNQVIAEIYASRNVEAFYQSVFASIQNVIPCELASFSEMGFNPERCVRVLTASAEHSRLQGKFIDVFQAYKHEHPLIPHCYSGGVVKITDHASQADFRKTGVHNEYYRHLDIDAQISFAIPLTQDRLTLFTLSRNRCDFSERDRLVLQLLRSHLITALRNATEFDAIRLERDVLQKGERINHKGSVLFESTGTVLCVTAFARELFEKYFGVKVKIGENMPAQVLCWIESEIRQEALGSEQAVHRSVERRPYMLIRDEGVLTTKLVQDALTHDCMLFMAETPPPAMQLEKMEKFGLSLRETEVLYWLSKGKINADIGVLLDISKRTVEKHVEQIFKKLGVETRAAAATIMQNEVAAL